MHSQLGLNSIAQDEANFDYEDPSIVYIPSSVLSDYPAKMASGYSGSGGGTSGGGGSSSSSVGTFGNPKLLSAGFGASAYRSPYWFKCTVSGSADFQFTYLGGQGSAVVCLQKGTNKVEIISDSSDSVIELNQLMTHSYYFAVKGSFSQAICKVEQHIDRCSDNDKRQWLVNDETGHIGNKHTKWTYFTTREAGLLAKYIKDQELVNWCLEFLLGSMKEDPFIDLVEKHGVDKMKLLPLLKMLNSFLSFLDLFSRFACYIAVYTAAGCDDDFNASNGIVVKHYEQGNGDCVYIIEAWDGTLVGPEGMRGCFVVPRWNSVWG